MFDDDFTKLVLLESANFDNVLRRMGEEEQAKQLQQAAADKVHSAEKKSAELRAKNAQAQTTIEQLQELLELQHQRLKKQDEYIKRLQQKIQDIQAAPFDVQGLTGQLKLYYEYLLPAHAGLVHQVQQANVYEAAAENEQLRNVLILNEAERIEAQAKIEATDLVAAALIEKFNLPVSAEEFEQLVADQYQEMPRGYSSFVGEYFETEMTPAEFDEEYNPENAIALVDAEIQRYAKLRQLNTQPDIRAARAAYDQLAKALAQAKLTPSFPRP